MVQIRLARESDTEAIAAIYRPVVESTVISFETVPPDPDEIARRMIDTITLYPWLVCEVGGTVAGYAYASKHRVQHIGGLSIRQCTSSRTTADLVLAAACTHRSSESLTRKASSTPMPE
jgi:L-amino acid N-acyltransferase YncA